MSTETATALPQRDWVKMHLALSALMLSRGARPLYRVLFRVALLNDSDVGVRLLGRKWVLRDRSGTTRVIEAQQVFNQRPVLTPGSAFSFGGCHELERPPTGMELRLFGTDQADGLFMTPPLVFSRRCFEMRRR